MKKVRVAGCLLALFVATGASGQEWTQWRGPSRDGSVSGKNVPLAWPESLKQSWRVDIGEGYSSPVVAGGRVFVHGRHDPEEIVTGINLADGKIIWQQKYQSEFKKNQYAVKMAKGPHATPLVVDNRPLKWGANMFRAIRPRTLSAGLIALAVALISAACGSSGGSSGASRCS